jgi:hypothetical protein
MLAEYIRDQYGREDELATATLIARCRKHFANDQEFKDALFREALGLIVPDIANSVRHRMRVESRNGNGGESARDRMARVFAFVGDDRSKSFLAMRRPDHLFAAADLERDAKGTLRRAALHRAAAALHEDDELTTGEILTDYQLETLEKHWLENESPPVPWLGR